MSLLLDAGALIAYEKGDRVVHAFLIRAAESEDAVRTATGVVAQVFRGGARQAALARLLDGVEEVPLTSARARAIGTLLAGAGTIDVIDVIDGSLIAIARDGDEILTSDPDDLLRLADRSGKTVIITPIGATKAARRR